ncbi:MAG TPA: hypothetical protein VF507_01215, partial [Pyrinomonadaceae bacterium]
GAGHALLTRFSGNALAVADQVERAAKLQRQGGAQVRVAEDDQQLWDNLAALTLRHAGELACRVSLFPKQLEEFRLAARADERTGRFFNNTSFLWHAGPGGGRLRFVVPVIDDESEAISTLLRLREIARGLGGSLVVEDCPRSLRRGIDAWGDVSNGAQLMRRIKTQLDPAGTFLPGRFVGGI